VLAAYLVVTIGSFQLLRLADLSDQQIALRHGIILLISTIILLVISHKKGEKS
jgi:hypothetical protein